MKNRIFTTLSILSFFFTPLFMSSAWAETVDYDLVIKKQKVNFTGTAVQAMTINGTIPGPTLRFNEGDRARIHVHNKMDVDSSIHWHGILLPPDMDGVPYITFPPIAPGATFTYEFPIRQSGTYWYHSHTRLQEQRGVYGSIVIEGDQHHNASDRQHVIVLSDWTDEDPHTVLRTLKRGSEWYALEKGSAQSVFGALKMGMLDDFFIRELQRMPPMDISDVAYDRFLANGSPETTLKAHPGETIRLRLINGSATTFFLVEFAGGPMTIVSADGIAVEPLEKQRLLIGVAETYDLLIKTPSSGSYEFRATAHDSSAFSSTWFGSGKKQYAPDIPKPNVYHSMGELDFKRVFALTPAGSMGMPDKDVEAGKFDQPGMAAMNSMDMGSMMGHENMHHDAPVMDHSMQHGEPNMDHAMNHGESNMGHDMHNGSMEHSPGKPMESTGSPMKNMSHSPEAENPAINRSGKKHGKDFTFLGPDIANAEKTAMDGMDTMRPWSPYDELRALSPTNFSADRKIRDIRLTLDGDMERYVWFLNNKPLSAQDTIRIHEGEVVRFHMINRTMMHHPMHLHGHFFRVLNRQGEYAPLKHTVDVAPMSTTVIEFDANEIGDWFFHCHLLYHMKSGMARVVHYENFAPSAEVAAVRDKLYEESWYFAGETHILSQMTDGSLSLSSSLNSISLQWEVGWEEVEKNDWEGILTWEHYFNRFFSIFMGGDMLGEASETEKTRAVAGLHYLLPLNIESRLWLDSDGGTRFKLEKELPLTPRLHLGGETEYDSHDQWEGGAELSYMLNKDLSLAVSWHSEFQWGAGIIFLF
ncbi:MAG: multicopper oxidase domain-containing protein [Desulfobulbaceae bacterium]|nr:multicopper oxidase domain-containing protein [Desulfobulbaceae bacterium]